jgi:hypothetical protein
VSVNLVQKMKQISTFLAFDEDVKAACCEMFMDNEKPSLAIATTKACRAFSASNKRWTPEAVEDLIIAVNDMGGPSESNFQLLSKTKFRDRSWKSLESQWNAVKSGRKVLA